jgi:hypothetical protein
MCCRKEGLTMSETTTLDAVRQGADAVSRLIGERLPEGEGGGAQDVVNFVRFLWTLVRGAWRKFQAQLDEGLEAGRARHAAASAALACDSLLRLVTGLNGALPAGEVEGLAELVAAVPEIKGTLSAARGIVNLLNAPAPPVDEERLARGLAAAQRGGSEDTAAIIEGLKAGGEL